MFSASPVTTQVWAQVLPRFRRTTPAAASRLVRWLTKPYQDFRNRFAVGPAFEDTARRIRRSRQARGSEQRSTLRRGAMLRLPTIPWRPSTPRHPGDKLSIRRRRLRSTNSLPPPALVPVSISAITLEYTILYYITLPILGMPVAIAFFFFGSIGRKNNSARLTTCLSRERK